MTTLNLYSCRSPYLDSDKVYPPLGILYLKSAINATLPQVKVNLVDNYNPEDKDQMSLLAEADYQGVSIMTPQRAEATKLRDTLKHYNPKTVTIAGGPHIKHYFEEAKHEPWDYLVTDDGQRALFKILLGRANKIETDKMSKEEWGMMPRPDRTSQGAKNMLSHYSYKLDGRPSTTMLTATGCPMACTFCEDAQTASRWSPLEKITKELDDITKLGYTGVYLFDDLFAISLKMVKPICEELKKRDLIYRCNGQANFFTKWGEDFAKMLADTGCYEIAFGHETGSQKILDNIRKRTSVEQNYKSTEYAKKHGIKVKSFLMLGLPGENLETMVDTERFIRETKPDDFQLAIYYPYKGTQIRDAIDKGDGSMDIQFMGEGLGAYGQKGGSTEAQVRTGALSQTELLSFRDYLVKKYKPESHTQKWKDDKFQDTHLTDKPSFAVSSEDTE